MVGRPLDASSALYELTERSVVSLKLHAEQPQ
jgi:hypothetical protein